MRYWILSIAMLFLACENPAPPEGRVDKLAKSLCGCTEQLLALNQPEQATMDSLFFRKIEAEFEKARDCAGALEVRPEDRPALETALKAKCPVLALNQDLLTELIGK